VGTSRPGSCPWVMIRSPSASAIPTRS
jgi:hypothetical protein